MYTMRVCDVNRRRFPSTCMSVHCFLFCRMIQQSSILAFFYLKNIQNHVPKYKGRPLKLHQRVRTLSVCTKFTFLGNSWASCRRAEFTRIDFSSVGGRIKLRRLKALQLGSSAQSHSNQLVVAGKYEDVEPESEHLRSQRAFRLSLAYAIAIQTAAAESPWKSRNGERRSERE